jgi:hypothetical protein
MIKATNTFVTKEFIEREKLGPGEDVFMVGRFIDHDGGPINRPAVRFGNISVMPAPIQQPNGFMADCYCVDLHSRSGYSGSPVFIYRTPGYDLEERLGDTPDTQEILLSGTNLLSLLGVHFAQFPEQWEIAEGNLKKQKGESTGDVPLIQHGKYIKGLSGMTCLLPAWTIWEVMNLPKLKKDRDDTNALLLERLKSEGTVPPVAESSPLASDANPTHREDFMRLVGAAARKPPQED